MDARLEVNIDHIAAIRQARQTNDSYLANAVGIVERGGAFGIVCHLREDRRHINERDLRLIRGLCTTHLNLELANNPEIIEIAADVGPDTVTFVPERREEVTTEGGLDIVGQQKELAKAIEQLAPIIPSAFIDPIEEQIRASQDCGFRVVELNTGEYANAKSPDEQSYQLDRLLSCAGIAYMLDLIVVAGHGLTYRNISAVAELRHFEGFNIGYSIISRAVFTGLEKAVREMVTLVALECSPHWGEVS